MGDREAGIGSEGVGMMLGELPRVHYGDSPGLGPGAQQGGLSPAPRSQLRCPLGSGCGTTASCPQAGPGCPGALCPGGSFLPQAPS